MPFKKSNALNLTTPYAMVYTLSEGELTYCFNINHFGAVFNINIKKEDTVMVEKLQAYLAELESQKAAVLVENHTAEIEAEVLAFKEALIKELELKRQETVAKIDSDIECINKIIARETAVVVDVVENLVDNVQ